MFNLNVPWLRQGKGDTPKDGGCIMQVIDWIDTGGWTDRPKCVHSHLIGWAIMVNDSVSEESRQKLLGYTSRLMGTSKVVLSDKQESDLADCALQTDRAMKDRLGRLAWPDPTREQVIFDAFDALLAHFERISGYKPEPKEIDYTAVCKVMQAA